MRLVRLGFVVVAVILASVGVPVAVHGGGRRGDCPDRLPFDTARNDWYIHFDWKL